MQPSVYIMANRRNGTLYTGVTSDLTRRVHEHREGLIPGFTSRYGCKILVWCEPHGPCSTLSPAKSRSRTGPGIESSRLSRRGIRIGGISMPTWPERDMPPRHLEKQSASLM